MRTWGNKNNDTVGGKEMFIVFGIDGSNGWNFVWYIGEIFLFDFIINENCKSSVTD